jgi:hypothetical protein
VEAIMGRPYLGFNEINKIIAAETVQRLYENRATSGNWATWSEENHKAAERLAEALMAAVDEGLIEDG